MIRNWFHGLWYAKTYKNNSDPRTLTYNLRINPYESTSKTLTATSKNPNNHRRDLYLYNPLLNEDKEVKMMGAYSSAKKKDLNTTPLDKAFNFKALSGYNYHYNNNNNNKIETFLDLRPSSKYGMDVENGTIYSSPYNMQLTHKFREY